MKFSPIVSIQGARQVGKSFIARNLLPDELPRSRYVTMDAQEPRTFASDNPHTFLTQDQEKCLIIDEVQKVPQLFDEMKAIVDIKRKPGTFVILGSTEFSHETQVRESLTGRLSRIRLFPLNLAETQKLAINPQKKFPFVNSKPRVSRQSLMKYLENGGFPGIFSVKNESERTALMEDWLKLTVERDLHQIKKWKLESTLAMRIIQTVARIEVPSLANLAKELRISTNRVQAHIKALKLLFVIFDVLPMAGSAGKPLYYLTDVGLLNSLGASFERKLITWTYLELLSQISYKSMGQLQFYYYKSSTSSPIHLIFEYDKKLTALKIIPNESYDKRDYLIFQAFEKKYGKKAEEVECIALFGGQNNIKQPGLKIYPWESIV